MTPALTPVLNSGIELQDEVVRVSVVSLPNAEAAEAAAHSLEPDAAWRCTEAGIESWSTSRSPTAPGPLDVSRSRLPAERIGTVGDESVVQVRFDEELIGGFDNTRAVTITARRAGADVVIVALAIGAQQLDPDRSTATARRAADDVATGLRAEGDGSSRSTGSDGSSGRRVGSPAAWT